MPIFRGPFRPPRQSRAYANPEFVELAFGVREACGSGSLKSRSGGAPYGRRHSGGGGGRGDGLHSSRGTMEVESKCEKGVFVRFQRTPPPCRSGRFRGFRRRARSAHNS